MIKRKRIKRMGVWKRLNIRNYTGSYENKTTPLHETRGCLPILRRAQDYLTILFRDLPAVNPGVLVAGI